MKNNKGYLIVELVLASVLSMIIAYFLLNLVIKVSQKNKDLYLETTLLTDKALMTNAVMKDISKYNLIGVKDFIEDKKITLIFIDENNQELERTISIENNEFTYGDYKKKFNNNIEESKINIKTIDNKSLKLNIELKTLYSNDNYGINLEIPYNEEKVELKLIKGIPKKDYSDCEIVNYDGLTWKVVKDNGENTTLILANNYTTGKYSDSSISWETSNAYDILNNNFVNESNKIKNDIIFGGIIKNNTSNSYVRLIEKDELQSCLSNDSETPFWTMTSKDNNNIWYASKDGNTSISSISVEQKKRSVGIKCNFVIIKICTPLTIDTYENYAKENIEVLSIIREETSFYSQSCSESGFGGNINCYSYCSRSGIKKDCNVSGFAKFKSYFASSNGCTNYTTCTTSTKEIAIGIRPVITVIEND